MLLLKIFPAILKESMVLLTWKGKHTVSLSPDVIPGQLQPLQPVKKRLVLSHGLQLQFDAVDAKLGRKYNLGIGAECKEIYFLRGKGLSASHFSWNAQYLER